ncbi:MAG: PhzF family phenazine biosynthesis protein [Acidimicrobiales bacterium]|nr:PhzF family phenazine biosynthesis protein [Acidimicrobiales bacterium]RZV48729.1 MAG: PhzF family phenazine biosynthesis protein [Acidimicrobiales bacterium]
MRPFKQVDVFTATPYRGNPVAVVFGADDLTTEEMQRFAHWTNLSETTFVLSPSDPAADYRVRIFTPGVELPFAGHPTIGTCHAWLEAGGVPKTENIVKQQCGVGLVTLRQNDGRLAFAAPPLIRSGPVAAEDLAAVCAVLQITPEDIVDSQWADNGPGWIAVMLADADAVRALEPDFGAADAYDIGVAGPVKVGVVGSRSDDCAIEVRAFFRAGGQGTEDPVTGSLNAALAQWLLSSGALTSPYVASQGTMLGRQGRVHVEEANGEIWIGGDAVTCVDGSVAI